MGRKLTLNLDELETSRNKSVFKGPFELVARAVPWVKTDGTCDMDQQDEHGRTLTRLRVEQA